MLTSNQAAHFHAFGFLVLRQLLTPDEVAEMKREADQIMTEQRGGRPFDPTQVQAVQPFFERRPFLAQLVEDDRIYSLGEDLCGPDFILDGTEGSLRVGDTPWHGGLSPSRGWRENCPLCERKPTVGNCINQKGA